LPQGFMAEVALRAKDIRGQWRSAG
ncbi:MAG: hypothetical protein JWO27_557, partial [Frankiales bacterium]|nr:hypothetical protein [Frankiales bacterium]